MPETACVTVEQLKKIYAALQCFQSLLEESEEDDDECVVPRLEYDRAVKAFDDLGLDDLLVVPPEDWLANAIAQAERLEDWKPKVGDRVRLKAMPEAGIYEVIETLGRMCRIKITSGSKVVFGIDGQWRERAELMPEEGL